MAVLISEGTSRGLSWAAPGCVIPTPTNQNLKSSYEASGGFRHCPVQIASARRYSHKAKSLKGTLGQEWWAECTFQGQGCGEEPLTTWVQLTGQLSVTSSLRPPPTPGDGRASRWKGLGSSMSVWTTAVLPSPAPSQTIL